MKNAKWLCLLLIVTAGLTSCRTAQEKMDFTISAHHYNCTPSEIVSFLNDANEDESAVIPDFVASKEQIPITGEDGTLDAYLTFTTDESGYTTEIKFYFPSPEAVEKGSRYLSLLFTEILGDEEASAECVELILESRRNEGMGMTKQENGSSITSMMTKGSTTIRMVPD